MRSERFSQRKISKDLIGNRNRNFTACSAVPQPTSLSRIPNESGATGFSLPRKVLTISGIHPDSHSLGTGGSFSGVKRPGREGDRSSPYTAKIKMNGAIPLLPFLCLHVVHRDFT